MSCMPVKEAWRLQQAAMEVHKHGLSTAGCGKLAALTTAAMACSRLQNLHRQSPAGSCQAPDVMCLASLNGPMPAAGVVGSRICLLQHW